MKSTAVQKALRYARFVRPLRTDATNVQILLVDSVADTYDGLILTMDRNLCRH